MKNNDDIALEIAGNIKHHRQGEEHMYAKNMAVGLANVHYFEKDLKLWIVNSENCRGTRVQDDGYGNPVVNTGPRTTYEEDGKPIFKNTKLGELVIRNSKGSYDFDTPKGKQHITIYNNAFYSPDNSPRYAKDIRINLNENKPRYYNDLLEILQRIDELDRKIIEAERQRKEEEQLILEQKVKDTKRRDELISQIDKAKEEKEEALNKMQAFIRKSAELRYQPILDPWQEEVKRSRLFDGTIAIDGGPGTGKTTSLIQRLKFLTDPLAINDYLGNLTRTQREKLTTTRSWIFFSPSDLLKQFLKNNMSREGLQANDETVKVWDEHKRTLLKKYKLINADTQNPFLTLRNRKDEGLLPVDSKGLKQYIQAFSDFFLSSQNLKLNKLTEIDVSKFVWKDKGKSIQEYIRRQEKAYNAEGLIRLYFNIQETYSFEVIEISKAFNELLKKIAGSVQVEIEKHETLKPQLEEMFKKWKEESKQESDDDASGSDEEFDEDAEEVDDNAQYDEFLFRKLKSLVRKLALSQFDTNQKITKREKEFNEVVDHAVKISGINELGELGQLAFFIKYFEKITKGVTGNLIAEIPSLYKAFRKKVIKDGVLPIDLGLMKQIVELEREKNKRLHPEEQAFLIYYINDLVKKTYRVSRVKAEENNHPYFAAYREMSIPVIGVDEATDFHIIDLLCMHSLGDIDISSVTFSGDLMQRFTDVGIRRWNELQSFIPNFEVKQLLISYRQSPTLMQVAQHLYQTATSENAEYISYMDPDDKEPKPLYYVNEDEDETIEWMANRILEIYKAYGNSIPSIAVFLPEENQLKSFALRLGEVDRLADVDIKVMACNDGQVLGEENTVRVFSLNYIKGLEFEAVFFHDIDSVFKAKAKDLMFKNLYVGLSRASFYLGITGKSPIPEIADLPGMVNHNEGSWHVKRTS